MELTKEQLSEVICKHTRRENGLQDLMEIMQGRKLTFRIPRDKIGRASCRERV